MPEWLKESISNGDPLPTLEVLFARVLLAMICGFMVALIYRYTIGLNRDETRTLPTTLVLLSVLIAVITLVIGNSVARAFGLVGALSIVRFRTVVEDTRDTAFVIFAVAIGMAMGAGYSILAIVGIPTVAIAALAMSYLDYSRKESSMNSVYLTIRIALGLDPNKLLDDTLARYVSKSRLTSVSTAKQGTSLELIYLSKLMRREAVVQFVSDLNKIEGVQNVEIRPI